MTKDLIAPLLGQGEAMPEPLSRVVSTPEANAARRRTAFQALLDRYGLTPTELARLTEHSNANLYYNFLNGRADGLALETIERILAVLPAVTFDELVGWAAPGQPAPAAARKPPRRV